MPTVPACVCWVVSPPCNEIHLKTYFLFKRSGLVRLILRCWWSLQGGAHVIGDQQQLVTQSEEVSPVRSILCVYSNSSLTKGLSCFVFLKDWSVLTIAFQSFQKSLADWGGWRWSEEPGCRDERPVLTFRGSQSSYFLRTHPKSFWHVKMHPCPTIHFLNVEILFELM